MRRLFLSSLFGKIVASLIGAIVVFYVPKLLGGALYGQYVLVWGFVIIVSQSILLGTPIEYIKIGADVKSGRKVDLSILNSYALSLVVVTPIIFFLIYFLFYQDLIDDTPLGYLLLSVLFLIMFRCLNGYNRGVGNVIFSQLIDVGVRSTMLLLAAFIINYNPAFHPNTVFTIAIILGTLISALATYCHIKRHSYKFKVQLSSLFLDFNKNLKKTFSIFLGNDIRKIEEQLMYLITGVYIGVDAVAFVAIASRLNGFFTVFISAASYGIIPRLRSLSSNYDHKLMQIGISFLFIVSIFSILVMIPFFIYMSDLVEWHYGKEYNEIVSILYSYLFILIISSFIGPIQSIATMLGYENYVVRVVVIAFPISIFTMLVVAIYTRNVAYIVFSFLLIRVMSQAYVGLILLKKERCNYFPLNTELKNLILFRGKKR